MNHAQIDWARRHLKPGMFVLQCADGDWREPALIQARALRLPTVVDDAEAAESVKALDHLPTRFAEEYANWRPDEVLDVSPKVTQKAPVTLSDVEFRFLESIIENPGQPSSRHARVAGISGRRAAELRRRFVAEGLLREHKVATAPRGRQSIVLEPLEPALRLVEQYRKGV